MEQEMVLMQKAISQISSETGHVFYFPTLIQTTPAAVPNEFILSNVFPFPFLWLAWPVRECVMSCPGGINVGEEAERSSQQGDASTLAGPVRAEVTYKPASD